MGFAGSRHQPTRERLARHAAVGLIVTAVGVVGYQSVTAVYGGGSVASILVGAGLFVLAVAAGYTRTLWVTGAGFLVAVPLLLLFAIELAAPMGHPPPERALEAWRLSIAVMVAGVGLAMLAVSWHVAVAIWGTVDRSSA